MKSKRGRRFLWVVAMGVLSTACLVPSMSAQVTMMPPTLSMPSPTVALPNVTNPIQVRTLDISPGHGSSLNLTIHQPNGTVTRAKTDHLDIQTQEPAQITRSAGSHAVDLKRKDEDHAARRIVIESSGTPPPPPEGEAHPAHPHHVENEERCYFYRRADDTTGMHCYRVPSK
jgi:hypothetical protein